MKMSGKLKKGLVFAGVVLLCAGIVSVVVTAQPEKKRATKSVKDATTGMPVSIKTSSPGTYPARVRALGEVLPRYRSTIRARVPGCVSFLSDRLQVGMVVRKGQKLVGIEKSQFLVQVAEAQSRLKTARLNILKEEREASESKKNWKRSGLKGKPASALVLRTPHIEVMRAELKAAIATLEDARVQLAYTEIRAPYDAVVMKRSVNPDETVFAGDEVAILYSLSAVEIGVRLDMIQWAALSTPLETTVTKITDPVRKVTWDAAVVRQSMHLDRETRLRTLYLEVKDPLNQTPPLLPGTFVRVELTGKEMTGLLRIPEAAQTKAGQIWLVDRNNRLAAYKTEPVFYGEGQVYVRNPVLGEKAVRVAVSPNASFTSGLLVQPVEEKRDS